MDESDRKTATADSFGEGAEGYRTSRTHSEGEDLDRLASWCDDATVALDVATGAGHAAGALREAGVPRVVAADASPAMVATSVRSFPVEGVVADAERLPFGADAFDAVTCRIAAHHFPDPRAFVAEVARVLRPGGVFALEDTVAPENDALASFLDRLETLRDPTHVSARRLSTWQRWLADAGFDVTETVQMATTLRVDPWIDRIASLDAEDGDAVRRYLGEAPPEAVECFGIEYGDGGACSFESPKGLFRAVSVD